MAEWVGRLEIVIMAVDDRAVEAHSSPEGLALHQEFLRNQGGYRLEWLNLEDPARHNVFELQFVVASLNVEKGLGSPVTPPTVC